MHTRSGLVSAVAALTSGRWCPMLLLRACGGQLALEPSSAMVATTAPTQPPRSAADLDPPPPPCGCPLSILPLPALKYKSHPLNGAGACHCTSCDMQL